MSHNMAKRTLCIAPADKQRQSTQLHSCQSVLPIHYVVKSTNVYLRNTGNAEIVLLKV